MEACQTDCIHMTSQCFELMLLIDVWLINFCSPRVFSCERHLGYQPDLYMWECLKSFKESSI